jgi:BirA family biotin operon repressor/biotin-[acetyl-CoA-carboxylase] ligase
VQDRHLQIVRLLADGERRSGEVIAAELGISRAAVWKAVHKAGERLGLAIEAGRGQGYRLRRPLELLDADAIAAGIDADAAPALDRIEVHAEIDSTNSHLLRAAADGAPSGRVCLAERQSAGRGRQGRSWVSPFGRNIYLSVLWRYPLAPAELGGLSLAAGVAVARALEAAGADGVGLKWPNDVHWRRRKLAGLLLEVAGEAQGPSRVVVGIGVNLGLDPEQGAAIDQPWTDLEQVLGARAAGRNAIAAALVGQLADALERYGRDGINAFIDDWRRLDAYHGEPVELIQGPRRIAGVHAGIDGDGALLLDTAEERRRFNAGEVSLRPARNGSEPTEGASS